MLQHADPDAEPLSALAEKEARCDIVPPPSCTQDDPQGPIVFVHIPKTAGSSLYSVFRTILRPMDMVKLHPVAETIAKVENLSPERRQRLKLIYGHIDLTTAKRFAPPERCISLLRHPVDRIVSFYAFMKYMNTGYGRELAMRTSLTGWIRELRYADLDNGMVRRLSGVDGEVPLGGCTREMLEHAKANLSRFAVVGLTERFDEFYALLATQLGWKIRTYRAAKVNGQRPPLQQFSPDELQEVERTNALDFELYLFAKELFERQLSRVDISQTLQMLRQRQGDQWKRFQDRMRRMTFTQWKRVQHRWPPHRLFG